MAQLGFDRRRINGPEESFPVSFDDSSRETSCSWSPRSSRGSLDIRPICMDIWLSPFCPSDRRHRQSCSSGSSARRTVLRTSKQKRQSLLVPCSSLERCTCAPWTCLSPWSSLRYGPRQSKTTTTTYSEKGRLNVQVKFAPFSCVRRRAPLRASLTPLTPC